MNQTKYLIGVDPGKATGLALISYASDTAPVLHGATVSTEDDVITNLRVWSKAYQPVTLIVERFVLREGVHGADLSPERVNGRIMQFVEDGGPDVQWNLPVQKEFASNDLLRRLDLWVKGAQNRHAMDAARHVVAYLVKMRHKPTLAKAFPE